MRHEGQGSVRAAQRGFDAGGRWHALGHHNRRQVRTSMRPGRAGPEPVGRWHRQGFRPRRNGALSGNVCGVVDLYFRAATAAESDFLADTVFGNPSQETTRVATALYGVDDPEQLRRLYRIIWRGADNWKNTELALDGDRTVGLVQTGRTSVTITPGVAIAATRTLGLGVLRVPFRLRTQNRVRPTAPDGAFVISEIHVVSEFRGLGIGNALLGRAEQRASRFGPRRCALQTLATNPARRLYERNGYSVAAETTDARFEQLTGVTGKILYVKDLDAT
jgi:ribosomal protein S18 acetylase RimI-like enzyme